MSKQTYAKLILPEQKEINLPVINGTIGPKVINISSLIKENYFSFDPGFLSTAACESALTYIDGNQGILLYRGYPIEQLAEKSDFMDVCYLLLYGELANHQEKKRFIDAVKYHTMVHTKFSSFFNSFRTEAHPMAILCSAVGAMSAFYHDSLDIYDPQHREIAAIRLISKMPTLAAMAYKYSIGQPFIQPRNELSYAANFLHMMFSVPCETYQVNPILEKAMDLIFLLHADHEQNASTSTVRLAGSSGANPFACIASGIAALWGPAHGGANEAVLKMLYEIGDESRIPEYIAKAKDPNDPFRLMGFGHRVYKNYDPRAKVLCNTCKQVLKALNKQDDQLFKLASKLEKIALEDPYFINKKLYPNVDFYSGIILKAIGIPTNMFTVIFALGRTIGWIAHWNEMMNSDKPKIGRPRQLYTGHKQRNIVDLANRKPSQEIENTTKLPSIFSFKSLSDYLRKWIQ